LDIDDLQRYVGYTLMPVYLQEELGNKSFDALPQSVPLEFEMTDGPHLGYAVQWWLFVPLLGWVYLQVLRTSEGRKIVEIIEEQN
jgi:surfeit locus 1 family protein